MEQGEGQEGTNMYTHYNGTHNNVCTKLRTTVYGGGRGLRGPVGVGWCACDKTNTVNHVHAHLVGVCRGSVHNAQCFGSYWTWGVGSTATTRDKCGVCDDVTG